MREHPFLHGACCGSTSSLGRMDKMQMLRCPEPSSTLSARQETSGFLLGSFLLLLHRMSFAMKPKGGEKKKKKEVDQSQVARGGTRSKNATVGHGKLTLTSNHVINTSKPELWECQEK